MQIIIKKRIFYPQLWPAPMAAVIPIAERTKPSVAVAFPFQAMCDV
jgi:hypothetical protein